MIAKKIKEFLKEREFVNIATCSLNNVPFAAPKFILKIDSGYIYLIDYSKGKSYENLKINPRVSLSFMDTETITGYRISGSAEVIEGGPEYDRTRHELSQKKISLSSKRVIEGLYKGRPHSRFEIDIPEQFAIFKVKVAELVEIGHRGEIIREKL